MERMGQVLRTGRRGLVTPANEILTLNPLGNIAFECGKLLVSYFWADCIKQNHAPVALSQIWSADAFYLVCTVFYFLKIGLVAII